MAFILNGSCLHTHAHNHNHSHDHHSHSKDSKKYQILLQTDNNPVNNNKNHQNNHQHHHHHHHNNTSSNGVNTFLNSTDSVTSSTYYLPANQGQNHSHSNGRTKSVLLNSTSTTLDEEKLNSFNAE